MNPGREPGRARRRAVLGLLLLAGAAGLEGCWGGEPEVPVVPSNKSRDQLETDIENPYGAPVKAKKSRSSRR